MSSHLSSMIVVGPLKLKLNKAMVAKVIKVAQQVQESFRKALEGEPDRNDSDQAHAHDEYLSRDELEDLIAIKPESALKDLVAVWNYAEEPDVNARDARIKGTKFRIVVAGDTSYGDEPQGDGYRVLLAAERLGMFPLLGLS